MKTMRYATITFDMDDLDVLAAGYGINQAYRECVYEKAVPRMLTLLDELELKATFFVIATKLKNKQTKKIVDEIIGSGHEIANHSLAHEHLIDKDYSTTVEDIVDSTRLIEDATGKRVCGYRGPSLTVNKHLPKILSDLNYLYDSSVNPTFMFIAEWIYLSLINPSRRNRINKVYFQHAVSKSNPYLISNNSIFKSDPQGALIELPISNAKYLKLPFYPTFHFMFPSSYKLLKRLYFRNRYLVLLGHGLDFLDLELDRIPNDFRKHPSLWLSWKSKKEYFTKFFRDIKKNYSSVDTAFKTAKEIRSTL